MLRFNDKIHLHILKFRCHFCQASVEGFVHHRPELLQSGIPGFFPGPASYPSRAVNFQGLAQGVMQDYVRYTSFLGMYLPSTTALSKLMRRV